MKSCDIIKIREEYIGGAKCSCTIRGITMGFFPLTHGLSGDVYTECNKSTHNYQSAKQLKIFKYPMNKL